MQAINCTCFLVQPSQTMLQIGRLEGVQQYMQVRDILKTLQICLAHASSPKPLIGGSRRLVFAALDWITCIGVQHLGSTSVQIGLSTQMPSTKTDVKPSMLGAEESH